jgi:hypothetical protein
VTVRKNVESEKGIYAKQESEVNQRLHYSSRLRNFKKEIVFLKINENIFDVNMVVFLEFLSSWKQREK